MSPALWLWFSLVFPSSVVVQKYLGWEGAAGYAIVCALAIALAPRLLNRLSERRLRWLALIAFSLVVVAYLVIYPRANTHVPGSGSDDDDAVNLGARALLAGHFPYWQTTYLGNVLHQLPGAFVLAAPFVLLGTSALQNLFWLPLFFLAVKEEAGLRTAVHLALLVTFLSPGVIYEVVTGTGYVSMTIYVLLGLWWLVRTRHRDVAAVTWGLALASRANFLFLLPLAFGWLRQHHGTGAALRAVFLTCATVACLSVPFYLFDARNFGPLDGVNRLLVFNNLFPYLGVILLVLMGALALALSYAPMDREALFRRCALVQAFPAVAAVALFSVQYGQLELTYARYGPFFAWFALMAVAVQSPRPVTPAPECAALNS